MIIEDVGVRDCAHYSVTEEDWPEVRTTLNSDSPQCVTLASPMKG